MVAGLSVAPSVVAQAQPGDSLVQTRATAQTRAAKRWPGKTIKVQNKTKAPQTVKAAIAAWNRATKGVKLKLTSSSRAQIKIFAKNCPANSTPCGYGPTDGRVYMGKNWGSASFDDNPNDEMFVWIVTHEIGHALGLGHTSGCAVMQPNYGDWQKACSDKYYPQGKLFCAPQRKDADRLAKLYKTKVRKNVGICGTFDNSY